MTNDQTRALLKSASPFVIALAMAVAPAAAWAQETPQPADAATEGDASPAEETAAENDIIVTGKFLDTGASSATKMDLPVLDTPFSVSAYTDSFMKAIETTNVSDLYRYMTGVQRAGNTGYDITLRGFKAGGNDRNTILTDGLPGLSVRFGSPPTVGVDHIEVVKGPTSVLYGQAQPGGFINIITKKPRRNSGYEFTLRGTKGIGDFDRASGLLASFDATGPIDANGNLLYRVVGEAGDSNGYRDFSYERPIFIAPSLTWNIGDSTSLALSGEHRHVKTHYDTYLVAPRRDASLIAEIDTVYQSPSDFLVERGTIGNVVVTHDFTDDVKFSAAYRYVDHFDLARGFDVNLVRATLTPATNPANFTTVQRRARGQANTRTYGFGDVNLNAKFDTGGIGHQLLLGVTVGKETSDLNRLQFFNAPATGAQSLDVNIYNPVYQTQPLSFYPLCNSGTGLTVAACSVAGSSLTRRESEQKSLGVYASDLFTFSDRIKALVGLRYADEKQSIVERRVAGIPIQRKGDTAWLPSAGLMFQPVLDKVTIYASYSTSFVPVPASNQDIFGLNPFKPTKANSIEGGVKVDLFDHRLTGNLAVFEIKKNDTINTFTCPVGAIATGVCSEPVGGERSRGVELEISANPVDGWNLSTGYAHTEARISKSIIARQVGARLQNSPDDAFNIWSRYDFQDGPLAGFGVGVGFAYIGDRVGFLPGAAAPTVASGISLANELLPLKSYSVVDLGLYYQIAEGADITFKVSNLLDKRFIESAGFTADINLVAGTPRTATLSARFKI